MKLHLILATALITVVLAELASEGMGLEARRTTKGRAKCPPTPVPVRKCNRPGIKKLGCPCTQYSQLSDFDSTLSLILTTLCHPGTISGVKNIGNCGKIVSFWFAV